MTIMANKKQKQLIHLNAQPAYIKEEFVQWATGQNDKRSCNDLTFEQANRILVQLNMKPIDLDNWAYFDKENTQHMYILSLCITYGWWEVKSGRKIANLANLNQWLHSNRCPVNKPLKDMETEELSKVIISLEQITKWKYSKPKKK